ncbi:MAG: SIMPL domain-containing protein [Urechidicola sp.]|nr:SIMPL domain-containing protein [Urechidicola sp.]
MKKIVVIIALLPLLVFSQKNFIDQPFIEVTGKMELEIIPDEIYISITINEKDKRNKTVEQQEKLMIQKLKAAGVDVDEKLSIKDFSGDYSKYFLRKDELVKYKNYELLIHKTALLPIIFKALDEIDISNVSIERTDHSDLENLRREAKLKALKIAKEKASGYATAIEQNVGRALYIQENDNFNSYNNYNQLNEVVIVGYGDKRSDNYEAFQDVQFSKINITATVLARFELK